MKPLRPQADWDYVRRKRRSGARQKPRSGPFGSRGREWSTANCPGSRLPLDFGINEGGVKGGRKVSVAENGIRVNDQVRPRGVVHIKAISAVTALTTWPDWLITKRCSNRNNNKCQSAWKENNYSAAFVVLLYLLQCILWRKHKIFVTLMWNLQIFPIQLIPNRYI